jgi:hypothetical protein
MGGDGWEEEEGELVCEKRKDRERIGNRNNARIEKDVKRRRKTM